MVNALAELWWVPGLNQTHSEGRFCSGCRSGASNAQSSSQRQAGGTQEPADLFSSLRQEVPAKKPFCRGWLSLQ